LGGGFFQKLLTASLTKKNYYSNWNSSGHLLGFIQSYLHERSQCVIADGEKSNWISVPSGVPQGSILGPLFFLLFINDMPNVSTSTTALFADDAKCFKSIETPDDCIALQNDINRFHDWSVAWSMTFNASKCKVLTISRMHLPIVFNYTMNNQALEHVGTFKDLGVVIDETLSFTPHIDSVVSKCNKLCGAIKRAVGFAAPQQVKLTLFNALSAAISIFHLRSGPPQAKPRFCKLNPSKGP
jgi:hypothetical protein